MKSLKSQNRDDGKMEWSKLTFGKHYGKTLPQVMFIDPDWFFHLHNEGAFINRGVIEDEAETIYRRATSIQIPISDVDEYCHIVYFQHPSTGKFNSMLLVRGIRSSRNGTSEAISDVIDLSYPTRCSIYDKRGCKLMIRRVKSILFGAENYTMSKARCEDFFNDKSAFRDF
ncbi:MAG: hypothetical protein HQK96_12395 [Nitrospirae bacterium]|nr:hypothetical protein [Nitrospirota bacterium]